MNEQPGIQYITQGTNWSEGWNTHEGPAMRRLKVVLGAAALLGLIVGAILSLQWGLAWWLGLVVCLGFIGLLVTAVNLIYRLFIIPLVWERKVIATIGAVDDSGEQEVQYEQTFQDETLSQTFGWVSLCLLNIIKIYRFEMNSARFYLVDVGFNQRLVHDVKSAGQGYKTLWKLNTQSNISSLRVRSVPQTGERNVEIPEIPSFDPKFSTRGGWVKVSYNVRVKYKIPKVRLKQFYACSNPEKTIENTVRMVARRVLAFVHFDDALIGDNPKDVLNVTIEKDPSVKATGIEVGEIEINAITGSKKLDAMMESSFRDLMTADDRQAKARTFATLDQKVFNAMIESEAVPEAVLQFRNRTVHELMMAMQAEGKSPLQIYQDMGQIAGSINRPDSLSTVMVNKLLDGVIEEIPPPKIPAGLKSHAERLNWERAELEQRIPHQLDPNLNGSPNEFKVTFGDGQTMLVIWQDRNWPPDVYLNGKRSTDMLSLAQGMYDYDKVTLWTLYKEAKELLHAGS